ncbi:MAG: LamG domain-containing protein, partial [Anaerolineales bacterium]|nr:LamG domain-containing protein [Anaerolineales bacterium]
TYGTNGFYQKYSATELAASFTDSAERSVLTVTANGNAHTDTTVKKIGTASLQLDGTGDYLSLPDNAFVIGTGDFTMEAWIKFDGTPGTFSSFFNGGTGDSVTGQHWVLYYYTSAGAYWGWSDDGTASSEWTSNWTYDSNWHHIAVCRQSGTYRFYLDGSQQTSSTSGGSQDLSAATTNFKVGSGYGDFGGYMDEVRYSDTCRYPDGTSFTPYTSALTADVNTKLLLHCDGSDGGTTFTDSSWAGTPRHTITANGDVTNSRAQKKIGSSSIYFEGGNDDYLSVPDSSDWDIGTGDFTFECWYRRSAWSGSGPTGYGPGYLWDFSDGTSRISGFLQDDNAGTRINWFGTDWSNTTEDIESGTLNTWHHIALVRQSGTGRWYHDGVQKNTLSSFNVDFSGTWTNHIGIRYAESSGRWWPWYGYIDEFRVSDTCRYPDGTTFTPSTTAFTADANTLLLIHSDFNGGLGADNSGNTNDFTPTNLVATNQMVDTPTNNWCTLNGVSRMYSSVGYVGDLTEGNLKMANGTGWAGRKSSFVVPKTGKFYCEVYVGGTTSASNMNVAGLAPGIQDNYTDTGVYAWFAYNGDVRYSNSDLTSTTAPDTGDIMSWYVNDGEVKIYLNNSLAYTYGTNLSAVDDDYFFFVQCSGSSHFATANFGQDSSFAGVLTAQNNDDDGDATADWYYAPPAGVASLCADNLSDPEIALPGENFNTKLYTGDGATTLAVTGVGFQPDFTWIKNRDQADDHTLVDSVRGATNYLVSNDTDIEVDDSTFVASLDSDGFTVGDDVVVNTSTENYASWNWKAGGTASSNTDGTITSSVSANTDAGFSIVSYTGNGTSGATVGHGLSETPECIITKNRNSTQYWIVQHSGLSGVTYNMYLQGADSQQNESQYTGKSSTTLTLNGASVNTNTNTYISYCFHSVDGYSKVGSYTGNGDNDGTFVYTGFRPMWVMAKCSNASASWLMTDSVRFPYNVTDDPLFANESSAETNSSTYAIDILSNGFKCRGVNNNTNNSSNDTYIYLAFAESPFKTANAR